MTTGSEKMEKSVDAAGFLLAISALTGLSESVARMLLEKWLPVDLSLLVPSH